MKVGVYVDDSRLGDVDISHPDKGNPGVGGTPFCFSMLLYFYKIQYPRDEIVFYHNNQEVKWPKTDHENLVKDVYEGVKRAKQDDCQCFLFRFGLEGDDLYDLFDKMRIPCIGWQHNFIDYEKLEQIRKHPYFSTCVFVGWAQYYRYCDHNAIKKCTVIENMLSIDHIHVYNEVSDKSVIYAGQISKLKGFSEFIFKWKSIITRVPDAQLYIMGNGKLYNKDSKLGPFNLADETYESTFADAITKDGFLMDSIHLLGVVGAEKNDYFGKCRVGVVNPIGSETLCITALEMEACGLPVVSKAAGGTLYSICNGLTGYLFKNTNEMIDDIVQLLNNEDEYRRLHTAGPNFVEANFSPGLICNQWHELFVSVCDGIPYKRKVERNRAIGKERIPMYNAALKKYIPFIPSISWIKYAISKTISK